MAYLKHDEVNGNSKKKKEPAVKRTVQPVGAAPTKYEQECMLMGRVPTELGGIECALEDLARHVGRFVDNGYSGENKLKVFTGPEGSGYYPVLVALDPCSQTTTDLLALGERIAGAFERIADALQPMKGGN